MPLEFKLDRLTNEKVDAAKKLALQNWEWWKADFLHHCGQEPDFSKMPVLQDYPRFRGFGADYSVFRKLPVGGIDPLREFLATQVDPASLAELLVATKDYMFGIQRISLLSKLLTMWKPRSFAMWDSYARNGLRSLHDSTHGHRYSNYTASTYEVYRSDFFDLYGEFAESLLAASEIMPNDRERQLFSYRLLDSILMKEGGYEG